MSLDDWGPAEELTDYEKLIIEEAKLLTPFPCVCGKHTFSVDEIQMGSVCPECNHRQDGTALGERPLNELAEVKEAKPTKVPDKPKYLLGLDGFELAGK